MIRYIKNFLSLCLVFVSMGVFAGSTEGDAAQFLAQKVSQFHHMTATFHQTVNDDQGHLLQVSTGRVMIQKPNQFRWEVDVPEHEQIISDGKNVWFYQPELKQVTVRRLDKSITQTPLMLLAGENIDWSKQFKIEIQSKRNGRLVFQLIPKKSETEQFKKIVLYFNRAQINEMDIVNILDQTTQIRFSDIQSNTSKSIDSKNFVFQIPKGIDVIEQSAGNG